MDKEELFFFEHAGYSHGPDETAEQGRQRGARELAEAEKVLRAGPYFIEVTPDSEPYDGDVPWDGPVWSVALCRVDDRDRAEIVGSVGGVACEEGDPYLRVVAAELASEFLVNN